MAGDLMTAYAWLGITVLAALAVLAAHLGLLAVTLRRPVRRPKPTEGSK